MRKNKYGNKRVQYQGKMFDSIVERDRFIFLQDAQRRGQIRNLRCQVPFSIDVEGQHICKYIADFTYDMRVTGLDGSTFFGAGHFMTVEDVKGVSTAIFKLKAKLMKAVHDIDVRVVKKPTDVLG